MAPSDAIIYSSKAWQILSRAKEGDKVAGTYLFYGPEGTGRWQTAISFAALLNCTEPKKKDNTPVVPCGECPTCKHIFSLSYEGLKIAVPIEPHENKADKAIDLTNEIIRQKKEEPFSIISSNRSTNIPISIAREIKKSLAMIADKDQVRVVLFYQMEKMNTASADALLKLIEEPPPRTVIILITSKPEALLPTIQSRSQKIKIDKIKQPLIETYLATHYEITDAKRKLISAICSGSLGTALQLLTDDSPGGGDRAGMFYIFKSLVLESGSDTLSHMNELLGSRDRSEATNLLQFWQLLIRDCAYYATTGDEVDIINVDFMSDIKKLSIGFADADKTAQLIEIIKFTLADLSRNVHIQGALMALALKMKRVIRA